jgi:hypothetical protein
MKNDAIVNNDVSADDLNAADDNQEQQIYEPSDRDKAIAEIARQAEAFTGIERDEDDDDEDKAVQAAKAETSNDDPLTKLGYYKNAAGELVTKIKVNGEEREISADQLKVYLQKEMAGDQKLQQAHQREQELARKEQWVRDQEKRLRDTMTRQPSPEDAANTRLKVKEALDKMWDGDTDAATEALAELLQRGNSTVDPGQIESLIERSTETALQKRERDKETQRWQQSVEDGNNALRTEHPEIYKDPRLFDLVNSETVRLMESPENKHLMPHEIIAKAAQTVDEWVTGRKSGSSSNSRETRKANLKPVVSGMNKVHRPAPRDQVDTSPSAVIARMRNSRAASI